MAIESQANVLHTPLLPGFIWVQISDSDIKEIPNSYLVKRFGGFGYIGRIDPDHGNGFEAIPFNDYPDCEKAIR
jgi:hypothetical protein